MTITTVLDGAGLLAWARPIPPRPVVTLMELIRRRGAGRVIVPSVVVVEALRSGRHSGDVEATLRRVRVETSLSLDDARRAAGLRGDLTVSAADAVVAETVVRHHADVVVTSDPDDLGALFGRAGISPHIIVVGTGAW
ncbi:PIN domain-containing protein [Euzebya tangerina]|uniref:PIN domain-containing protein n=1 Tax=Euzebya tangerina TaxID=591198 RepID=UPI000E31B4AA|nr:PIN domain-containing protein [Euzebya tangerina]